MDYKQKFEDALENLRKIKEANQDNKELVDFIEYKYPELKESEDERIRKRIIEFLSTPFVKKGMSEGALSTWIAWLEKQPAWSEEDEMFLNLSIVNLTELKDRFGEEYGKVGDCIAWLNTLKERMKG